MNFTELEAAEAAGVSIETIREFTSIGLLKGELKEDKRIYSQGELEAVFRNLKTKKSEMRSPAPSEPQPTPLEAAPLSATIEVERTVATREPIQQNNLNSEKRVENTLVDNRSLELLELNRTMREQIQLLREERDWLRKRIEVLETRAERDQILLLTESRTVQNLIPERKWSLRSLLPWGSEPK
jgi:DNA-binding transcriptional MerR regulator